VPFNPDVVNDCRVAPSTTFTSEEQPLHTSSPTINAESFLIAKGRKVLENVQAARKRNTLSEIISGKAITEDDIVSKIQEHVVKYPQKGKKNQTEVNSNQSQKTKTKSPVPC
jgi:hypothetical protein